MHKSQQRNSFLQSQCSSYRILCLSRGKKENEFQNSTFLEWDFGAEKINGKGLQQLTTGTTNTAPLYMYLSECFCRPFNMYYNKSTLQFRMVQSYRQCFNVIMLFVSTSLAMPSGKIHTKNLLPAAMDCRTVFTGHPSLMVQYLYPT